jgi:hydrogenase assembly chaperone HypC/HupF
VCITAPARVIAVDADGAVVEIDGARRRASTLVVPEVAAGDWVMVGAGTILRRLEAREGLELAQTIAAAVTSSDARLAPEGGQR